jgi:hypothetical protein
MPENLTQCNPIPVIDAQPTKPSPSFPRFLDSVFAWLREFFLMDPWEQRKRALTRPFLYASTASRMESLQELIRDYVDVMDVTCSVRDLTPSDEFVSRMLESRIPRLRDSICGLFELLLMDAMDPSKFIYAFVENNYRLIPRLLDLELRMFPNPDPEHDDRKHSAISPEFHDMIRKHAEKIMRVHGYENTVFKS